MGEWKIHQMVCVLNYQPIMEIGRHAEEFKSNIYTRFKHIGLVRPQQFGPVQVVNFSYTFKHADYKYTVNMAPDSLTIIAEVEGLVADGIFEKEITAYMENIYYIWDAFKRCIKLYSLTRAGLVAVFLGDPNDICVKTDGQWNGFYHADRKFKFDKMKIIKEKDDIEVVDNIFYDYDNDIETLKPIVPKRIIDIALIPKSSGVVATENVEDLLVAMRTRLDACFVEMFNV